MKVHIWLRRLLAILAVVGLVAASFTAPVSGPAMAAVSDTSVAAMPEGMPCCPDETPAVPDCPMTCPLMAMCAAKAFSNASTLSNVSLVLRGNGDAIRPHSDVAFDALTIEPPTRPPRI